MKMSLQLNRTAAVVSRAALTTKRPKFPKPADKEAARIAVSILMQLSRAFERVENPIQRKKTRTK